MQFKDYYRTMGVEESATPGDIKKAYRRLARKYHPDVSKEADAEQKFKELGEAYEVLKDEEKRREYDQLRKLGARGRQGEFRPPPGWESAMHFSDQGSGDFSDFFESLFGREGRFHRSYRDGQAGPFNVRGEDIHAELSLFLEEIVAGTEKNLELQVPVVDASTGLVSHQRKTLRVKIPAGTGAGRHLRLRGQGAPGIGSGANGDLIITVRMAPHPLFSVQDRDVSMVLPLAPWEAALGAKLEVPTPGGKVKLGVPAGTQAGARLRLKGRGLPGSPPGDFFAVVKIVMPKDSTEQSRELFARLAEAVPFEPRQDWED